jgi:hypothetical protein
MLLVRAPSLKAVSSAAASTPNLAAAVWNLICRTASDLLTLRIVAETAETRNSFAQQCESLARNEG